MRYLTALRLLLQEAQEGQVYHLGVLVGEQVVRAFPMAVKQVLSREEQESTSRSLLVQDQDHLLRH